MRDAIVLRLLHEKHLVLRLDYLHAEREVKRQKVNARGYTGASNRDRLLSLLIIDIQT